MKLLTSIAIIVPCIIGTFFAQFAACQALAVTTDCTNPVPDSCNFYTDCLENKFHCGATGYPLDFGYKYCEKFASVRNQFSNAGSQWLTATMLCLQKSLVATYENDGSTCADIESTAVGSHANCYLDGGICDLPPSDWALIFLTVGIGALFGSLEAIVQALETAAGCAVTLVAWLLQNHIPLAPF